MERVWYSESQLLLKESWKEIRQAGRRNVMRWLAPLGLVGLFAALWWHGFLGHEALLGLVVFGTIWGGDKGPGSDEPEPPWWWKVLLELIKIKPTPEPERLPPFRMPELPRIDPLPPLPTIPFPRPIDTEEFIRKFDQRIAEELERVVKRGERPVTDVRMDLGRGSRPTLHFEIHAPRMPAEGKKAREETFSEMLEMLERFMQEPAPREETFSEKLARHMQEPPDFRTPGEKRRDERQAAARRDLDSRTSKDKLSSLDLQAKGAEESSKSSPKSLVFSKGKVLRQMERARLDR